MGTRVQDQRGVLDLRTGYPTRAVPIPTVAPENGDLHGPDILVGTPDLAANRRTADPAGAEWRRTASRIPGPCGRAVDAAVGGKCRSRRARWIKLSRSGKS